MPGIDAQVAQRVNQFQSNPAGLQQSYKQNRQLIDLLALQKLKNDKDQAANEVAMRMGQKPPTVMQQRENEVYTDRLREAAQGLGLAGQQDMQQRQAAANGGAMGGRPAGGPAPAGGVQGLAPKGYAEGGLVTADKMENPRVKAYIRQGMSPEEAIKEVFQTTPGDRVRRTVKGVKDGIGSLMSGYGRNMRGAYPELNGKPKYENAGQKPTPLPPIDLTRPSDSAKPANPMGDELHGKLINILNNAKVPPPASPPVVATLSEPLSTTGAPTTNMLDPDVEGTLREAKYDSRTADARQRMAGVDKEVDRQMQWRDETYSPEEMKRRQQAAWVAGLAGYQGPSAGGQFSNAIRSRENSLTMQERNRQQDQSGITQLMTGQRDVSKALGVEGAAASNQGRDAALRANSDTDRTNAIRQQTRARLSDSREFRKLQVLLDSEAKLGQTIEQRREIAAEALQTLPAYMRVMQALGDPEASDEEKAEASAALEEMTLMVNQMLELEEREAGDIERRNKYRGGINQFLTDGDPADTASFGTTRTG